MLRAALIDLRSRTRAGLTFFVVVSVAVLVMAAGLVAFHAFGQQPAPSLFYANQGFGRTGFDSTPGPPVANLDVLTSASRGAAMLVVLAGTLAVLGGIIGALSGATAIAGDVERETLDVLLTTQLGAVGVAGAKLLSSWLYALLAVAAAAPVFALLFVFSPLPWLMLAAAALIILGSTLAGAAVGLFFSALTRSSPAALLSALTVVVLAFLGGGAVILGVIRAYGSASVPLQLVLLPSPVAALLSSADGQFQMPNALVLPALLRASPAHPVHLVGAAQLPIPLWCLTLALDLLIAVGLAMATARAVGDGNARRREGRAAEAPAA